MEGLEHIIQEHSFFAGMDEAFIALLAGCAKNARFKVDQYLAHEGDTLKDFYLLRAGRVALQIPAPQGTITVQTVHANEIVGASWLVPPYRWGLDAKALAPTRAIALDAACLRGKCDADPSLGYELMKRFMPVFSERLQAARHELLEIYTW
jgi:CRP/FNR family transcriptional regulator, cyclic AMP receptor protein